jgi:hypothetical protein
MLKEIAVENQKLLKRVMFIYGIMILLSIIFIRPTIPFVVGLSFGCLVAVLNFFELALTFKRAIFMPSHKAQRFAAVKYLTRYGLTAGVLLVSFVSPTINPFGTVLGLLIIKGVLYGTYLTKKKEVKLQESLRKEE